MGTAKYRVDDLISGLYANRDTAREGHAERLKRAIKVRRLAIATDIAKLQKETELLSRGDISSSRYLCDGPHYVTQEFDGSKWDRAIDRLNMVADDVIAIRDNDSSLLDLAATSAL